MTLEESVRAQIHRVVLFAEKKETGNNCNLRMTPQGGLYENTKVR